MPSILSHPAAALSATWFRSLPPRVITFGVIASVLPDIDTLGFAFGIPYGSLFGHRGFTHSILFAALASLLFATITRPPRFAPALLFLFLCAISHPLFDALTNGGRGIAFFSPFTNHRYFFPWRPIRVSPIGVDAFATERGLRTLQSELRWVWLPWIGVGLGGWVIGRRRREPDRSPSPGRAET